MGRSFFVGINSYGAGGIPSLVRSSPVSKRAATPAGQTGRPRAAAFSWREQLKRDLDVLEAWLQGKATVEELSAAAARLVDSRHRGTLAAAIEAIPRDQVEGSAGLAYAAGCLTLAAGDEDGASGWFAHAQAVLDPTSRGLAGRIAFELGFVQLANSRPVTADTLLAWAESMYADGATNADLLHLRAVAAEHMGDHAGARELYRAVLERSAESLTPMTRVLAMTNLAVSMNHVDPEESLSLTRLAATLIDAEELDPRIRAALSNIETYAFICLGRLDRARVASARAIEEARAFGHRRVELYALFNTAIIDEFAGEHARAHDTVDSVRRQSAADGFSDLQGWAAIRLAWLRVREGEPSRARELLEGAAGTVSSMRYSESLKILSGLINFGLDRLAGARLDLESALRSARQRGDLLTQLALLLWLARLEERVGRRATATRLVLRALELSRSQRLRLSPNWWTSEIVRTARLHAVDASAAARLLAPRDGDARPRKLRNVQIFRDGAILISGRPLPQDAWRVGRTGSRVLRRFFRRLATAYPAPISRNRLAEYLWPESDGDRAIRNLYSATVDLRRLLADVPGLAVAADASGYALLVADNVEFPEITSRPHTATDDAPPS